MGWAGGSILAKDLWSLVRYYIPVSERKLVARQFVEFFEKEDCDTIYEAQDLVRDAGLVL